MTEKEFMNRIGKSRVDFLQLVLDILKKNKTPFCVVGGLAVNAYAEPVVSLDLDMVVVAERLNHFVSILKKQFTVKKYPNSINASMKGSDFRLQIQTGPRYFPFVKRAVARTVLGYRMPVAKIEDVLQGKIWSALDKTRRPSKRQKDLADILRLIETKPKLTSLLPSTLKKQLRL